MLWFHRRGKRPYRKGLKVPETSAEPLSAYVERESPLVFRGIRLPVKVGRFDDIHSLRDLEEEVARKAGGHGFVARVHKELNKKAYLGTHRFAVAADPLIDGEPVAPRATKPRKSPEVLRIERETEAVRLQMKLDEARAEAARAKRARRESRSGGPERGRKTSRPHPVGMVGPERALPSKRPNGRSSGERRTN